MGATCEGCCGSELPHGHGLETTIDDPLIKKTDRRRSEQPSNSNQCAPKAKPPKSPASPVAAYTPSGTNALSFSSAIAAAAEDSSSDSEAADVTPSSPVFKGSKAKKIELQFRTAVLNGDHTVLETLHKEHPEMDLIHCQFPNNEDCLQAAVDRAHYEVLEFLLRSGVSPNKLYEDGETVLFAAVRQKDRKMVKLLIDLSADPTVQNDDGATVLHVAVHLNDLEMARLLHENGADEGITNNQDERASDIAYRLKYDEIFDALMDDEEEDIFNHFPQSTANILDQNAGYEATGIYAMNTERLENMTDDLFDDIEQDIQKSKAALVPLSGWLHKKQSSPPYSWLKRWVVVQGGFIMWSDRQILPDGADITEKEKKRWNQCFALEKVQNVNGMETGKSGRKLKIKFEGEKREYIWRAENKESRDKWVQSLQQHTAVYIQGNAMLSTAE